MEVAPHIIVDENICFGKPVVKGTRVPVALVLEKLAAGIPEEEIIREYEITDEDIKAILRYAANLISEEQLRIVAS